MLAIDFAHCCCILIADIMQFVGGHIWIDLAHIVQTVFTVAVIRPGIKQLMGQ